MKTMVFTYGNHGRFRRVTSVDHNGERQAFYESSGDNSGMPGVWLPFDGIALGPWFDKNRYTVFGDLHRFGNEGLRDLSKKLAKRKVVIVGESDSPILVNKFLNTRTSLHHAKIWENVGGN